MGAIDSIKTPAFGKVEVSRPCGRRLCAQKRLLPQCSFKWQERVESDSTQTSVIGLETTFSKNSFLTLDRLL